MTTYCVRITETAENDIDETLGYLIAIKHNPTAALKLLEEIEEKIQYGNIQEYEEAFEYECICTEEYTEMQ